MNIYRSRITAVMTLVLSILALIASLEGILNKRIYEDVLKAGTITKTLLLGSIAQDIISIPLGLILVILSVLFLKRQGYKTFIAILGLTGNFFYGYGLYAIQGQYTSIYLIYLAVFMLSIYSLIFGLLSFEIDVAKNYHLPRSLGIGIIVFMIIIISILGPGWILGINANIAKHIPPETYGVFVLDLCIVFPALGIIISQYIRKKPFATTLAGVALFKIFGVCLSWGFSQWFVTFYDGIKLDIGMTAISTTLTLVSLILIVLYMFKLHKGEGYNG